MLPLYDNIRTRRFPLVTVALIAANAAVWLLYQVPALEESVYRLGFLPCEPEGTCDGVGYSWPANVLTSMFAHGSWTHIIGNMLFLWIFGNNVEDALGRVRYLVFYLAAGVAATAAQTAVTLWFGVPERRRSRASARAAPSRASSRRTSCSSRSREWSRSSSSSSSRSRR